MIRYFLKGIANRISLSRGMSFSGMMTENALQFSTSLNGGTKLSAIITGTHSQYMASTILGLFTSQPIGQMQYLLDFMCSGQVIILETLLGKGPYILMSSSLSLQCFRSVGRTLPCMFPAKNARIGRCDTLLPPTFLRGLLGFLMVVSGSETSFPCIKILSDTSALQSALIVFVLSSSCSVSV